MKRILCGLALLFVVGPAPAQTKDEVAKMLVGKWAMKDTIDGKEVEGTVDFTADGKMTVKATSNGMEVAINGTYKVIDGTSIEMVYDRKGETKKETSKVKVTKENLEITNQSGTVMKFTRK